LFTVKSTDQAFAKNADQYIAVNQEGIYILARRYVTLLNN
jgi:hypothetical protein